MVELKINGVNVSVEKGAFILEAAEKAGLFIPTLCDDARVEKYGACGVCVVENLSNGRLLRACSTVVADNMEISTDSEKVQFARKGALDLLLSDHSGDCRPPCSLACPAGTDCQGYVGLAANGYFEEAATVAMEKIPFPASIGRVCPRPCEEACRRKNVEASISIAKIKQFVGDYALGGNFGEKDTEFREKMIKNNTNGQNKKIAIIGGGPGGLSAAYYLAQKGYKAVVFEGNPKAGGMLRYGIPAYRLPKNVLDKEIEFIEKCGVEIRTNTRIGKDITLDELRADFDAVVVAVGAQKSAGARCKGENLAIGGIEFLRSAHDGTTEEIKGKTVAVIGGGNTAMDVCRTAVRLGAASVYNIYRRTRDEMPAEKQEILEAEEEGVIFKFLLAPLEITKTDIKLQLMALGEPDSSGRRSPIALGGKEETLPIDIVVAAVGQQNDNLGLEALETTKRGTIRADENTFATNIDGVFAIGDATNNGADIAVAAIGEGGRCAATIDKFLRGEELSSKKQIIVEKQPTAADFAEKEKIDRIVVENRPAAVRKNDFAEVCEGFSAEEAAAEAKRCLECGCMEYFDCKLLKYANMYGAETNRFGGAKSTSPTVEINKHLERNAEKCILCGLCVRVCKEEAGADAIGFVGRGFGVTVAPAKSDCTLCGLCVSLCPTGALTEKFDTRKNVPLQTENRQFVCTDCDRKCAIDARYRGTLLVKNAPADNGLICGKGKFKGILQDPQLENLKTLKP